MKTLLTQILALFLAQCGASAATFNTSLAVAIFDFDSKDEAVRELGPKVAAFINAELSTDEQIITVERMELQKVLGEQELGLSGTVNPTTAAKVGQLTGANVLITGQVLKDDRDLVLLAKIISTETGRVYGELVKGGGTTSISDLSSSLAKKLRATMLLKSDTLHAKAPTSQEHVDRLKAALVGKTLVPVSVKITERHFGGVVIDPAAETELGSILQQCGFKLVDDKSPEKPEVEITGEAFSAFGMRRGYLISCKGRVEVKVQKRNGDILAVDRQTSVAVDLSEQTAAKSAIAAAAAELAERVVPKLVN